ncbi:MAG TPA: helix-turn-helix domain-containing protein [Ktedonobacteraceae bacterium]
MNETNRFITSIRRAQECSVTLSSTRGAAMTLAELIGEALMTNTEVAAEAGLSPGTVSRMVNGHPTSRLSARKVLAVLTRKLGRKIEIGDIKGLNITD